MMRQKMKPELMEKRTKNRRTNGKKEKGRVQREGYRTKGDKKQQKGGQDGVRKGAGYYPHVILPGRQLEMETEFTYS